MTTTALGRWGGALGRMWKGPDRLEMEVGPAGPRGELGVPSAEDGVWEVVTIQGRPCLTPNETSYYLYVTVPPEVLARAPEAIWLDVEYFGERYGEFRVQYASRDQIGRAHV